MNTWGFLRVWSALTVGLAVTVVLANPDLLNNPNAGANVQAAPEGLAGKTVVIRRTESGQVEMALINKELTPEQAKSRDAIAGAEFKVVGNTTGSSGTIELSQLDSIPAEGGWFWCWFGCGTNTLFWGGWALAPYTSWGWHSSTVWIYSWSWSPRWWWWW